MLSALQTNRRALLSNVALILFVTAGIPWRVVGRILWTNWSAVGVAKDLAVEGDPASTIRARLASPDDKKNCQDDWLDTVSQLKKNLADASRLAQMHGVGCSELYVSMLAALAADNAELAQAATREYPNSSDAWFWLASTLTNVSGAQIAVRDLKDYDLVLGLYEHGQRLAPYAGLHWREFGDLIIAENPAAALEAYVKACIHGDPGYHGCLRAGRTAEQLGLLQDAVRYYRMSSFPLALERAAQLEQQISSAESP